MSRYLDSRGRWTLSLVEAAAVAASPTAGVGLAAVRAALFEAISRGLVRVQVQNKGLFSRKRDVLLWSDAPELLHDNPFIAPHLPSGATDLQVFARAAIAKADDTVAREVFPSLAERGLWAERSVGRIAETCLIKGIRETAEGEQAAENLRRGLDRVSAAVRASHGHAHVRSRGHDHVDPLVAVASRADVRALVSEMGVASLVVPGALALVDEVVRGCADDGVFVLPAPRRVPANGTDVDVRPLVVQAPADRGSTGLAALADLRVTDSESDGIGTAWSEIERWFEVNAS